MVCTCEEQRELIKWAKDAEYLEKRMMALGIGSDGGRGFAAVTPKGSSQNKGKQDIVEELLYYYCKRKVITIKNRQNKGNINA